MGKALGALFLVVVAALVLYALNAGVGTPGTTGRPPPPPVPEETAPPRVVPEEAARKAASGAETAEAPIRPGVGRCAPVTGTVVDDATGKPIPGAVVRVLSTNETTTTDAGGVFSFPAVRGKLETIRVEADGYPYRSMYPDLTPGRVPPPLNFRLKRGAVVCGTVLAPDGTVLPGASVSEVCNPDRKVLTGSDGGFRLAGARRTGTIIRAEGAGHLPGNSGVLNFGATGVHEGAVIRLRRGGTLSGVVLDFGGTPAAGVIVYVAHHALRHRVVRARTDRSGRFSLEPVGPGTWIVRASAAGREDAELEVRGLDEGEVREGLEVRFGGVIAGVVVDQAGAPVPSVGVRARVDANRPDHARRQVRTDAEGRFSIALPWAEEWELHVQWPGGSTWVEPVRATLGARDVVIRLPEPAAVSGRVVRPDGKPVREFKVLVHRENAAPPGVIGGKDGAFLGQGLAPGKVTLTVRTAKYWSEGEDVVFEPGKECANVRIELREFGVLDIRVVDAAGRGVPRAIVQLHRVRGRGAVQSGSTDADGSLRFDQVRPGKYVLLAPLTGRLAREAVTVKEGGTERITLTASD